MGILKNIEELVIIDILFDATGNTSRWLEICEILANRAHSLVRLQIMAEETSDVDAGMEGVAGIPLQDPRMCKLLGRICSLREFYVSHLGRAGTGYPPTQTEEHRDAQQALNNVALFMPHLNKFMIYATIEHQNLPPLDFSAFNPTVRVTQAHSGTPPAFKGFRNVVAVDPAQERLEKLVYE